jgi:hypothetical protein
MTALGPQLFSKLAKSFPNAVPALRDHVGGFAGHERLRLQIGTLYRHHRVTSDVIACTSSLRSSLSA